MAVKPKFDELVTKNKGLVSPPSGTSRIDIKVDANVDLPTHVSTHGWVTAPTTLSAKVTMVYFGKGDTILLEEKADVAAQIERLPPFSQRDVLLRSYRYFHQVLPFVENLTPDQAVFYLEEKALAAPNSATFLGISVPKSMILITAGSMLGLLFVFSRTLSHMNRTLASNPENLQTLRGFSWVALFDDKWSRYFNYLSILVLPTAAVCFLGWSSLLSLSASPSLIGLALLLAATGASILLSHDALSIVGALRSHIAVPEPNTATTPDEG